METSQETIARKLLRSGAAPGLFFLLFYLYVWLVVDPRLIFHELGVLVRYSPFSFRTDGAFLLEHLGRVGGLAEYATRLLTQFYRFGWAGALVVAAVAWCLAFATERLIRRGGWIGGRLLPYVPAAIILMLCCGYDHLLGLVLPLLTALGGFAVYARLAPEGQVGRIAAIVIVCPALYYAAGAGGLLFAVLVILDELLIGKRKAVAGAALACILVVPWVLGMWSGLELGEAYAGFLLSAPGTSPPYAGFLMSAPGVSPSRWAYLPALYFFFPIVFAGSALLGRVWARKEHPSRGGQFRQVLRSQALGRAVSVAFFCGIGAVAWLSLDSSARSILAIDYEAQHEHWREVLAWADRIPEGNYSIRSNRNIVQALYHTGRLPDQMFRYAQRPGADLFFTQQKDRGAHFQESRLFLDLGQVNFAERCAYEVFAGSDQPELLEQLALIHVLRGHPGTARMYLKALAKHLFYGQAAREMLRRLEADPALENDPEVSRIREMMPTKDRIPVTGSKDSLEAIEEEMLKILLEENPHNQMAFEMLMAHYLVNRRTEKVVANLSRLKDFSYPRIPQHYQEAFVVHVLSSKRPPPDPGFEPDPEVFQRAQDFQQIRARAPSPQEAMRAAAEAGLDHSYFFYLVYGVSGR